MDRMNVIEEAIHREYRSRLGNDSRLAEKWDIQSLTRNRAISLQFILDHADLPWDWRYLTNEIPLDFVYDHPNYGWDWKLLSLKATPEIVQTLNNKPWDWSILSQNNNVVESLLLTHPEYRWDYKSLSKFQLGISNRDKSITYTTSTPAEKKPPPLADTPLLTPTPPVPSAQVAPQPQSQPENLVICSADLMMEL